MSKYLCVLNITYYFPAHIDLVFNGEESTNMIPDKPEIEDSYNVDSEIVLGVIDAEYENVAILVAKSKFQEQIEEVKKSRYYYDSWVEVTDIESITY